MAESELVQSLTGQAGDVSAPGNIRRVSRQVLINSKSVIDGDGEGEGAGVISDNEHRPLGKVTASVNAVEIHHRNLIADRVPQADVVPVIRIVAAVPVLETIGSHFVVVRSAVPGDDRSGGDAGGESMAAGLKMPWGPWSGTRRPLKRKPSLSGPVGITSPYRSTKSRRNVNAVSRMSLCRSSTWTT